MLRSPVQSVANEISETSAFKLDPYGLKDVVEAIGGSRTINYLNKFGSDRNPTSTMTRSASCMRR